MAGSFLSRLLRNQGYDVDIFDVPVHTRCGITCCGWGASRKFYDLVAVAGLDPHGYILEEFDYVFIDKIRFSADLLTFDKPALIKDLLGNLEVRMDPLDVRQYDKIIDATGVARAFLPSVKDDMLLPCVQYRVRNDTPLKNMVKLGGVGYAWCFPLSDKECHVGGGSHTLDPEGMLKDTGWLTELDNGIAAIECRCRGTIRVNSPAYSEPFTCDGVHNGIWGVAESIGCVSPLTG
jgi:hypothetical protein